MRLPLMLTVFDALPIADEYGLCRYVLLEPTISAADRIDVVIFRTMEPRYHDAVIGLNKSLEVIDKFLRRIRHVD